MTTEFTSIADLAAHLGGIMVEVDGIESIGLNQAALVVERRAKAKIGHYQEESGEFAAWAELADSTKDDRLKQGFTENDPGLRTGDMRDSIGHMVGHHVAHVGSNDDKLVWFELGTEKQPPRSVLGGAAIDSAPEVVRIMGARVVAALVGQGVVNDAMLLMAPGGTALQFNSEAE